MGEDVASPYVPAFFSDVTETTRDVNKEQEKHSETKADAQNLNFEISPADFILVTIQLKKSLNDVIFQFIILRKSSRLIFILNIVVTLLL